MIIIIILLYVFFFIMYLIISICKYIYFTRQNQLNNFDTNSNIIILTNIDNQISNDLEQILLNECPICYEIMDTNIIKTTCNHIYHNHCLITWINSDQQQNLKCPLCLQNLTL